MLVPVLKEPICINELVARMFSAVTRARLLVNAPLNRISFALLVVVALLVISKVIPELPSRAVAKPAHWLPVLSTCHVLLAVTVMLVGNPTLEPVPLDF